MYDRRVGRLPAVRRQTAVTAYLKRKQSPLFAACVQLCLPGTRFIKTVLVKNNVTFLGASCDQYSPR